MKRTYKEDWAETCQRFELWWANEPMDRPLICVTAPLDKPLTDAPAPPKPDPPAQYLDVDYLIRANRWRMATTWFGGDAIPIADANLGPGSLALYLGSEPGFDPATVWFRPCIDDLDSAPLPRFDPQNKWFRTHLDIIRRLREDADDEYWVSIPDIIESVDILAAMRDPMAFIYDLVDRPQQCHRWLKCINDLYFPHYDAFYDIVKDSDGGSVFTAFRIWGPGKTAKVQCDFAAMMSPDQFDEFYVPYVTEQISQLDRSLYHLDGPDAVRHVDSLLRIEKLNAIQWVSGAGKPSNGDEVWFPMYEKILGAGKGLQISVNADHVEPIIRRLGARGLYLITHVKTQQEARDLLAMARRLS